MRLTLRPYQVEALDRIAAAEARGVRAQLGVAATGLGKTLVFCALAERRGKRTLILAHRDELVAQAEAKVREVWPEAQVGVVKGERNEVRSDVVVASVQTLSRPRRLAQLLAAQEAASVLLKPSEPFDLVVVDEAHHAPADSYRTILSGLAAGTPDGPLLLGVTATPDRGDGKGLDALFSEIVFSYDLLWGIRAGYLADVRGRRVKVANLDLAGVRVSRGDYDQGQAGRAMEAAGVQHNVVRAWLKEAAARRTLVFTPTVEVARLVAEEFRTKGVAADYVHGGTPLDERRSMLARYQSGDLQVLANCSVLVEGFDAPRTDCIVMARPTKSRGLFAQMIGRGTRPHPDKVDCLVLDVIGGTDQHSLVTVPSLFGLEKGYAKRLGDGTGRLSDVVQERDDELVRVGRMTAADADMFRQMRTTGIAWVSVHKPGELRRYVRDLGTDGDGMPLPTVVLAQRAEGDVWTAGLWWQEVRARPAANPPTPARAEAKQVLLANVSMEMAQGVADDYVRRFGGRSLTDPDAKWRKGKPSDRAVAAAKRWHLPNPEGYATAGELSDAMDAHVARIKARKPRTKVSA